MKLHLSFPSGGYDILFARGGLSDAHRYFDLDRRVLVITDSGVPACYAKTVAEAAKEGYVLTVAEGEESKSVRALERIASELLAHRFTRADAIVAVGGGVVGDLSGFAASVYMRGIDFYNIPTTVLSMVDSSVGGKCAINFGGIKNLLGSFYQPKGVLIDASLLSTLPERQIANGLAEAVKMAMTSDESLFHFFETETVTKDNMEEVLFRAVKIKAEIVMKDEKETGLRKILNFGHTYGHAIEAYEGLGGLYHGECVALGMLPMCEAAARDRLLSVLKKLSLPTSLPKNPEDILAYAESDKKRTRDGIDVIYVKKIGQYEIQRMTMEELKNRILSSQGGEA